MVHPVIKEIFLNQKKVISFFLWTTNQLNNTGKLQEFFKLHLEVISEVIDEIEKTQDVDFSNKNEAKLWANKFLENYDEKIRKMRNNSNQIFERFHELKKEFDEIILKKHEFEKELNEIMLVFLNKHELLIGKIIFSYREIWFLANQVNDFNFKLGSIESYQKWVKTNFSNLKKMKNSLEDIELEISKEKR
ncbi:MAG: hypothetical protein IS860_04385 [Nitrosopumilus sp.]|nr:hypothetical protein [Nitrosopumilus sp.]